MEKLKALCNLLLLAVALILVPFFGFQFLLAFAAYMIYGAIKSCWSAEVYPADTAAWVLFHKNRGKTEGLPPHLRGVFWFSTNGAPELLMTFDGSYFNPERQLLKVASGGVYNWTYSADCVGWVYWFFLRLSNLCCAELHIDFTDSSYRSAHMPLYICGVCPNACPVDGCWMPMGMIWYLNQYPNDPNVWDRPINLCISPDERWETGSYTLKRIIDEHGQRTPYYAEFVRDMANHVKVKGLYAKPIMQIVNGDRICGCGRVPEGYEMILPPSELLGARDIHV